MNIEDKIEQAKKLHQEVIESWRRYQELNKSILSLQAEVSDLFEANKATGKKLYELYHQSDNGLDDELNHTEIL